MPTTFQVPRLSSSTMVTPVRVHAPFQPPLLRLAPRRHQVARFRPTARLTTLPSHHRPDPSVSEEDFGPVPFVSFDRHFTPEGGIEYAFLAYDERFWAKVLRFVGFAWTMTATLTCQALTQPGFPNRPMSNDQAAVNAAIFLGALLLFGWFFFRQHYVDASIEIRKDCMIIDGTEVFWRKHMLMGWPVIVPQEDGTHLLQGIYGSRLIVFFRMERKEPEDKFPELLGAQIQFAMQQLWRE